MDWSTWYINLRHPDGRKYQQNTTALDHDDAKKLLLSLLAIKEKIAEGFKVTKIWKPIPSTHKQKLAHHYRSCIGAASMLAHNLTSAINGVSIEDYKDPVKIERIRNARALAIKQTAKVKRDVKDLFKLMGLNING